MPITHAADASIAPITVLLADDDADFRRVYRRLFDASDGFRVLDEAGTVGEAIRKITALHPDVSLVDVQMPGGSGLDVLRGITDSGTRTIMLTAFDLDEYVAGALEWGASGFLLKNASSSDVLSAVRAVHAGHASLAPEITARLMSQFAQPSQPRHPFADVRLSARELQITRLVAQGRSNQQIADELFLSLPTVRTLSAPVVHEAGRERSYAAGCARVSGWAAARAPLNPSSFSASSVYFRTTRRTVRRWDGCTNDRTNAWKEVTAHDRDRRRDQEVQGQDRCRSGQLHREAGQGDRVPGTERGGKVNNTARPAGPRPADVRYGADRRQAVHQIDAATACCRSNARRRVCGSGASWHRSSALDSAVQPHPDEAHR